MLLHEITLRNVLSFGPNTLPLSLGPLNVLIGPNGSGKSNFFAAISLLQAAPKQLVKPIREGGGILDWLWKGAPAAMASVEVSVEYPEVPKRLRHTLGFNSASDRFELCDERVEYSRPHPQPKKASHFYDYNEGRPVLIGKNGVSVRLKEPLAVGESILSQRKDPEQYPQITYLGQNYERIRFYREWTFGRNSPARRPQKADLPIDFLSEDLSNIGLVLNRLSSMPAVKREVLDELRQLYPGIEDFSVSVVGGTVQVFVVESGFTIPATRLSDGTLRYLSLLAILCHPEPPPLVCIEEPELGLHPDLMPTIARLLKSAAQRMQLIVTTHSDILIDELSDQPESVVVCEKKDGATTMKRLDRDALAKWLERYRLGQLWTQGEIGGTRW